MSAIFKYEVEEDEMPAPVAAARPLIHLEKITKVYDSGENEVQALRGVDVSIGRGKSTLMHILGCLDSPTSGSYWLDDEDVAELSGRQLARIRNQKLGFVFQ